MERFLRNASLYLLNTQEDVDDGDTADGPGDVTWTAMECEDALSDPPRPTILWVPEDGTDPPEELLDRGDDLSDLEEIDFGDEEDELDDELGEFDTL